MDKKILQAGALQNIIVTVVIVLVLGGIYYQSLEQSRIENRRKEAQNELLKLKSNIEQQAVNGSFKQTDGTSVAVNSTMEVVKLLQTSTTTTPIPTINNYYNIAVTIEPTTPTGGYILTATPHPNGPQTKDITVCQSIVLKVAADGSYNKNPPDCWK